MSLKPCQSLSDIPGVLSVAFDIGRFSSQFLAQPNSTSLVLGRQKITGSEEYQAKYITTTKKNNE